jgi:hypothetical protein
MSPRWSLCLPLLATMAMAGAASAQPADPYAEAPAPAKKAPPAASSAAPPAPPPAATGSAQTPLPAAPPPAAPPPSAPPAPPAVPLPHEAPPTDTPPPVTPPVAPQSTQGVHVFHDDKGWKLQVDGRDTMVLGMNWGYSPIGTNYSYSFWTKSDAFITRVLDREMGMLRDMGVNAIRLFSDVPPRWITWIYDHYGIYTSVNHLMGRYGFDINGAYVANINYGNPVHRKAILDDLAAKVERYRGTRGLLFYLLGNENNYGLAWTSFEIAAIPGKEDAARAESLYSLMGEAVQKIKARDTDHPVALVNGDAQYLELIAKHCKGLDAFGANVYRGPSARDLFDKVKKTLGLPVMFTEFGADAFDAKRGQEDHVAQADYLRSQWEEIYQQSHGKGLAGNAIGGFIFQWDDGWWKVGQETNLDVHDTKATWPNEGYGKDFSPGDNNMNEEWFGLVSKDRPDADGFYEVHARAAYYLLKEAFTLDPYAASTTPAKIKSHFERLRPRDFATRYDAEEALARVTALSAVRLNNASLRFDTFTTGGNAQTARKGPVAFDHTESMYLDFVVQPSPKAYGRISLNVIGNVAENRLDRIFYETRGIVNPLTPAGSAAASTSTATTKTRDRVAVYQAEFNVDQPLFALDGYYRTGHYHWGDEGDFFGLYPEANYGPNLDRYNGGAPFGVVASGKKVFDGLKIAFGPELYWGANPALLVKYRREIGRVALTAMYQEDLSRNGGTTTSSAVPEPVSRKATLHVGTQAGPFQIGVGGIMSSPQQVGREFFWTRPTDAGGGYSGSGYELLKDKVKWTDTLGGKAKIVYEGSLFRAHAEAQLRGLVSNGGPDSTITLTRWSLKESGRGNQASGIAGFTVQAGDLQIGPNVLYQKPLIGPMPTINDSFDPATKNYSAGFRARNVFDDPFAVLDNRETFAGEMLLVYDPTPATWYGAWDRELREDARFAGALDFVYRHQPTSRDANIGYLANGTAFSFPTAPPKHDTWDLTGTFVSNFKEDWKLSGLLFLGQAQARGDNARLITRYGGTMRLSWNKALFTSSLFFKDWGPYDYHRDFNLTYPLQWYGDLSLGLGVPVLRLVGTRFGFRWQLRTLDEHSEGYLLDPAHPGAAGLEYELGTYVNVSM